MNDIVNYIIFLLIGIIFLYSIVELISNGIGVLRMVKMI